jgi:hypothetical protein
MVSEPALNDMTLKIQALHFVQKIESFAKGSGIPPVTGGESDSESAQ